jgi:hypothetical protein
MIQSLLYGTTSWGASLQHTSLWGHTSYPHHDNQFCGPCSEQLDLGSRILHQVSTEAYGQAWQALPSEGQTTEEMLPK